MGTPHKITESRLRALVLRVYLQCERLSGKPKFRVQKNIYIGKLEQDELADTWQVLNKSYLSFSDEFIGSRHVQLLEDVIRHEMAHVWAGTENQHNAKFKRFAKLFKAPIYFY